MLERVIRIAVVVERPAAEQTCVKHASVRSAAVVAHGGWIEPVLPASHRGVLVDWRMYSTVERRLIESGPVQDVENRLGVARLGVVRGAEHGQFSVREVES